MSKTYFTSDWHLNEDRIGIDGKPNLFYRPFDSTITQNYAIIANFVEKFEDGDTLYHLGDVFYNKDSSHYNYSPVLKEKFPNSKFHLIIGNYDEKILEFLSPYFDTMQNDAWITLKDKEYYLNHYPVNCRDKQFSITGHIHGLWKVQKNMINVGVDAWHFNPVSEDEIDFCRTACEKYYDQNVFPY